MELWLVAASCSVIYLIYQIWKRHEHFQYFKRMGIPGPPPSFFWGNMYQISKKGHLSIQREWHSQYGPVVGYFFGYDPVLLISDTKHAKSILLKDFTDFTDRPEIMAGSGDNGLTVLKGQRWKDVRSTLTPSFTISKLKQLSPEVGVVVDEFMTNVHEAFAAGGRSVDMYELYQALTLDTICRSAMGVDFGIQKDVANSRILQQVKLMFSLGITMSTVVLTSFPFLRKTMTSFIARLRLMAMNKGEDPVDKLKRECTIIVKQRRTNPNLRRLDLLQLMIDAQSSGGEEGKDLSSLIAGDEAELTQAKHESKTGDSTKTGTDGKCPFNVKQKSLTDEEVIDNAFLVLLAGYETTSSSLAYITRMLVRFPDVQERLREALIETTENGTKFDFERLQHCQYLDAVIQESLRMYPPIFCFTVRQSSVEKQYGDLTVPKDMPVFISTCEMQNNPDIFPEPEVFDPDRFLPENRTSDMAFAWQPFGAGPRNCIGMRFAQMEIKIALAKLLTSYRLTAEKYDTVGDAHVNCVEYPALQRIKDPLLLTVTKIDS